MTVSGGPSGSRDPMFDQPFVDVDEWRDDPVRHRYVHGGFEGDDTRFSIYLPPPERYEGRFFHPVTNVSGTEHAARVALGGMMGDAIEWAVDSGGYLVESNQGRAVMFPTEDPTISGYRASAAVASYSRVLAAEMYGPHRPYGYVYGGSGGAYKAISCLENGVGVWDGAVPFIHPTNVSIPNTFTVQAHAFRVLHDVFPQIIDAVEPGGSGDMYAGLDAEQREALAEVTRMGFPPRAWFDWKRVALGYTGVLANFLDNFVAWDPDYFEDFWTVPGYLGANPPDSLLRARVEYKTTISQVVMLNEAIEMGLLPSLSARRGDSEHELPAAVRLASVPDQDLQGATLTLTSGEAAGHVLHLAGLMGEMAIIGFGEDHLRAMTSVRAGDEVVIDNARYLATQTYHRHQVPSPDLYVWDQFRAAGEPVYPQRADLLGPRYTRWGAGSLMTGRFTGKMIVVHCLLDEAAYPWHADWYRNLVQDALGPDLDDRYRLWFLDNAMHLNPVVNPGDTPPVRTTRIVGYAGVLQQALRDLSDWVEKGLAPPRSTTYEVGDGQVRVPATAPARRGIQPVVTLTANGGERAEVGVGEAVELVAHIEVPPGAGTLVGAEWDFEGRGDYPVVEELGRTNWAATSLTVATSHAFSAPGTYFPVLRATSHRQGDAATPFARVQNLARARVVVA